jgi:hypothetical protein
LGSSNFTSIETAHEKNDVLDGVVYEECEILCQMSDHKTIRLKTQGRTKSEIYVKYLDRPVEDQEVHVYFSYRRENYYLKTKIKNEGRPTLVTDKAELYRLKQRVFYRVKFENPENAIAIIEGAEQDIDCPMTDLSGGGFCFLIDGKLSDDEGLVMKAKVTGIIKAQDFNFDFKGEIRHCYPPRKKGDPQRVGLKFIDISVNDRQKIIQFVMSLDKEASKF